MPSVEDEPIARMSRALRAPGFGSAKVAPLGSKAAAAPGQTSSAACTELAANTTKSDALTTRVNFPAERGRETQGAPDFWAGCDTRASGPGQREQRYPPACTRIPPDAQLSPRDGQRQPLETLVRVR